MKFFFALLAAGSAAAAFGQGHNSQPPFGLGVLAPLVGSWGGKSSFDTPSGKPFVIDTTLKVTPVVQGHYLREEIVSIIPNGGTRNFLNMLTYDNRTGDYKEWWFTDNAANEPVRLEGRMDNEKHTLVLISTNPTGVVFRNTFILNSPTSLTYSVDHKEGDKWVHQFTTEFKKAQ